MDSPGRPRVRRPPLPTTYLLRYRLLSWGTRWIHHLGTFED